MNVLLKEGDHRLLGKAWKSAKAGKPLKKDLESCLKDMMLISNERKGKAQAKV